MTIPELEQQHSFLSCQHHVVETVEQHGGHTVLVHDDGTVYEPTRKNRKALRREKRRLTTMNRYEANLAIRSALYDVEVKLEQAYASL